MNKVEDVKFEFSPRSFNITQPPNDDEKRNQRRNKLFRRIQMDIKDRDRLRKKMGGIRTVRYKDHSLGLSTSASAKSSNVRSADGDTSATRATAI